MTTTNEPTFRRCRDCGAWNELGDDYGECWRHAPVILQPTDADPTALAPDDVLMLTFYPVTGPGEGCFESLPLDAPMLGGTFSVLPRADEPAGEEGAGDGE